ncbi:MAG TPA: hypothetical protein VHS36_09400, partial [Candidatus Limnocylindrales bacterium]|nr:hypothetical protein [Candidatus Limnocylindrales bacterium]
STLVAAFACLLLIMPALVPPAAAAPPTTRQPLGRLVGSGVRVDARVAGRAGAIPRAHRTLVRRTVKLGPARAPKGARPTPNALSRVSGTAGPTGTSRIAVQPQLSNPALTQKITTNFPGLAQAGACGTCEPPDPWIAVSPSYLVQSTNGMVRISNRFGSVLLSVPTSSLFSVPSDRYDSDPRILWDGIHGRWVGVIMTYNFDASQNGLELAVSATADPRGAWTVYSIDTGIYLPDYPGISSSPDEILLTSDDFDGATFAGPTLYIIDWSNVSAGTSLYVGGFPYNASSAHFRPALMLSAAPNVPVIYETAGGTPGYFEVKGTARAWARVGDRDLSTAPYGLAPFADPTTMPQPVQPGGVTISQAVDERPTDAVYRDGQLWFVATGDYFDTTNHWTQARYSRVSTAANETAPSAAFDFTTQVPSHYFMPGVGISGNGTAFLVATVTDASQYPKTVVAEVLPNLELSSFTDVEGSTEAYSGDRWGDFVGVAADPSGSGSAWFSHEIVASGGGWRTSVARVVSDADAPSLPGVITQALAPPATLGSTVPLRVAWAAATDPGSGVKSYLVERSDDGGPFVASSTPATSVTQSIRVGHLVRYRVSAIDDAGNVGPPQYGATYRPLVYQQGSSTVYRGTWGRQLATAFSGGSAKYATRFGRYVTFTATSARSIAFVTTRARTRGAFRVYVDGHLRATVSAWSAVTRYRQLIYQYSWGTPGTHRIRIYVLGTVRHPRVDVDAFVVLR